MANEPLSNELYEELGSICRGQVYARGEPGFDDLTIMFNGNVVTHAKAVVCPLDAEDVSKIVQFCVKHKLSPSVKAGGYGTAGWAIGGDIIVDLCKLVDVDIEPPHEDGSFTSLRDTASTHSKGKKSQTKGPHPANAAKRRREDDANLREYSSASKTVSTFLSGTATPNSNSSSSPRRFDSPTPSVRRKTGDAAPPSSSASSSLVTTAYEEATPGRISASTSGSDVSTASQDQSTTTNVTTPALSPTPGTSGLQTQAQASSAPLIPDVIASYAPIQRTPYIPDSLATSNSPFGYLDSPSNFPPAEPLPMLQSSFAQHVPAHAPSWNPMNVPIVPAGSMPPFSGSGEGASVPGSASSDPASASGGFAPPEYASGLLYGQISAAMQTQAEPIHPHAFVTFGAGMRQKEIDTFTAKHKLEARYMAGNGDGIPYHVPFAAHPVGSSIMLLGGFGFLSRLHGLSIDNLVEVEMVLADGRIVVVGENENPDLWWALRGAGPCFGIATRYKAKAYPVPVVFAGNLIYRFNKATAPSLIRHFRDCVKGAPRELYANVLLTAGPAGKDSLMVVQMCYVGPREKGQEYLQAISSWDGEKCLLNEVDEKSFLHQQDSVAQVLRGKAGRQWFIRSALISSLPDDIIGETVIQFADSPVGCTWLFELAGGAIPEFEDTCLPKSQREATFTIAALHQWEMDVDDTRCVDSAEEWISGTLKPIQLGGPLPSFLGRHEPPERTKASFGSNWQRLCEIKQLYDPNNLFRNTFWPLDATGEIVEPYTHEPPTPPFLSTSIRGEKKKIFT